ncbi:MAG: thioredoxin domain-containing protein [Microcystaceae cyanobacterium]
MLKRSTSLWLSLCLSSLAVTVGLVTGTSLRIPAMAETAIAQVKNPCASRNPCASKNPCAGKTENVGGPLAEKLQGKPVIVDVYATWCSACNNIAPTLSQLKKDYRGQVNFVVFDVSDKRKARQSEAKARELGLGKFFEQNKSRTGMITVIDPTTGDILTQHYNNANLADYTSVLNTALSR